MPPLKYKNEEERGLALKASRDKHRAKPGIKEREREKARDYMRRRRSELHNETWSSVMAISSSHIHGLYTELFARHSSVVVKASSPVFELINNPELQDDDDQFWLWYEPNAKAVAEAQAVESLLALSEPRALSSYAEALLNELLGICIRRELDDGKRRNQQVADIIGGDCGVNKIIEMLLQDWKGEIAILEAKRQRLMSFQLHPTSGSTRYIKVAQIIEEWTHRRVLYKAEAFVSLERGTEYYMLQATNNTFLSSASNLMTTLN